MSSSVLAPLSPIGRSGANGVYDERRNRMILFGGKCKNKTLGDTWELSFSRYKSSWRLIATEAPDGPLNRCHFSSMYFPDRHVMLIWGGYHIGAKHDRVLDDLWCFDLVNDKWYEIDQSVSIPRKRTLHSGVYFAYHNKMVIYGGAKSIARDTSHVFGDVWALDLNNFSRSKMKSGRLELTWEQLEFERQYIPQPRFGHLMEYSSTHKRVIMFGGSNGTKPFTDLWSFGIDSGWKYLQYSNPFRPEDLNTENVAHCIYKNKLFMYSGGVSPTNTVWTLDITNPDDPRWSQAKLKQSLSEPRWKSAFVYNCSDHTLIVFSGSPSLKNDTTEVLSDSFLLDLTKIENRKAIPR